jgi:hypothetical protein
LGKTKDYGHRSVGGFSSVDWVWFLFMGFIEVPALGGHDHPGNHLPTVLSIGLMNAFK